MSVKGKSDNILLDALCRGYTPDPDLTVSEFADQYINLPDSASEKGRWRTSRVPHMREVMDCLSARSPVQEVVFMKPTQIAGTSAGNNWFFYTVCMSPGSFMLVLPTVDMAKAHSKQKLDPAINSTPILKTKFKPSRSRDSNNTTLVKKFEGGILAIVGANSGVSFRDKPVKYLHLSDVDGYPRDVDKEGDPIGLAINRTDTYGIYKKIYIESTPTLKDLSRIEAEYKNSDRRRRYVPCPHCKTKQVLMWDGIVFEHEKYNLIGEVKYRCQHCGVLIKEYYKTWMFDDSNGAAWIPENPGHRRRGYWLNSLYSPLGWLSWADITREFLEAKKNNDPVLYKKWVNTRLAETYEEKGDEIGADTLKAHLELYKAEVPQGVVVLVAAVDVQRDRLECHVVGFGACEESWLIAFSQLDGNPEREQVWFELDKFLSQEFNHESGCKMRIEAAGVDSGFLADMVYRFCKPREHRKIWVLKGDDNADHVVKRTQNKNRYNARLYMVGTHAAKDIIISRMRINKPGPGYMHLPTWIDDEYLAQLTAEKAIRKYIKGRGAIREYIKTRERNEALDLTVYSLATLYTLGPNFVKRLGEKAQELMGKKEVVEQVQDTQPAQNKTRKNPYNGYKNNNSSWVSSWR